MTSSDRFPVPVKSAVKSNLTDWCFQNLSKRALNALTVQASTTELGKLFQIFTMRAEKNAFVSHNERYNFAVYSGCCCHDEGKDEHGYFIARKKTCKPSITITKALKSKTCRHRKY